MLSAYASVTMIPAKDLQRTRRWYEDVLELSPSSEDPTSVQYRSAGTTISLYETMGAGTAQHTLMGWTVDDIERVVDGLAARGVMFEHYDMPGLKTDGKGIAAMDGERGAWFKDPEGNILSIWQLHS